MHVLLVGPEQEENLSLRYPASSLVAAGHGADIVAFDGPGDAASVLEAAPGYDLVGLSLTFQVRAREFLALARELKALQIPVVAGGHYATCAADELLANHPEIEVIVVHEGERTLVELASSPWSVHAWAGIPGLVFRDGDRIRRTSPRGIVEDLDSLPTPDRRGPVHLHAGVPTAYMMGSRGCVARCDYCCIMTLHRLAPGRRFRQRDPGSIADEMAALYHDRGIRQFVFHDDNFLVPRADWNHRRIDGLRDAWREHRLDDIGFTIKCRPPDARADVFARLKQLGLLRVFLGVESSTEEGLVSIGRRQTVEQSEAALEVCRQLGISAQFTMMMFHPDATLQTVRSDVEFMARHEDAALNFCRTEIYAGTPLEQRMVEAGRSRGDYLARSYVIADPRVELASQLARRIFMDRCWSNDSLMKRVIGADHLAAVVERFYGEAAAPVIADVRSWRRDANRELVALLGELLDACVDADPTSPVLHARVRELVKREQRGRRRLEARGDRVRRSLDAWVLPRAGLRRDPELRPARSGLIAGLAPHAAAVLLAMTVAGCGCQGPGVCEYAAPPLEDTDGDGLPDDCETSIFGTDPNSTDSDGNGVLDGDEDHDGDGLTNSEEQDQFGDYNCGDAEPQD